MKPASTSPDPAVANVGGALVVTETAVGLEIAVSGPFSRTVHLALPRPRAPLRCAWATRQQTRKEPLELALVRRQHVGSRKS